MMSRQCRILLVAVFSMIPIVIWAQSGSALKRYQDSLASAEGHLKDLTKGIKAAQDLQRRMNSLKLEMDPVDLAAGCRQLDSLMTRDSVMAVILARSEGELAKLAVLRAKIASTYTDLVKFDTSTARGKKQFAASMKKYRKDQDDFTRRAAVLLQPIRSVLTRDVADKDAQITQMKSDQAQTVKSISDFKWKIEMEELHEQTVRGLVDPPPATIIDLLKAYADLIEAADRDKLHTYDTLFQVAGVQASSFLQQSLLKRHQDNGALIPQGSAATRAGAQYTSRGFIVSRTPLLQPDVLAYLVTTGERGLSFVRLLRAAIDRPVENVPADTLARVAERFGGRLLTENERDFIEASGFSSMDERLSYGVLSNFYEVMLNQRYAYVCWDTLGRGPALAKEFQTRYENIMNQREECAQNAWRSGTVWNPKRFIISFGGLATGFFAQHTEVATSNHLKLIGAGLGSGSLLLGYRYAIDGSDLDGETYGYIGFQFSYLKSFGKIQKAFGSPAPKEVQWSADGYEVALVATLLHSFYLGAGIGHLKGDIETSYRIAGPDGPRTTTSVEKTDDLPGHYVFPFGFIVRAGTNFSFNFGGAVRWKGVFTQPSPFFGLGVMIDIPVIRLGA